MGSLFKSTEYGVKPNTYDLMKCVALFAMIIDHIGYYFFPTELWFRTIGRIAFPLFLFLVGYSGRSRFDGWLLAGGTLLWLNATLTGNAFTPLNILFSILLWRWLLGYIERFPAFWSDLGLLWVALLLLYLPSLMVVEYGTLGLMFVCIGYLIRVGRGEEKGVRIFILSTMILMVAAQTRIFGFSDVQMLVYIAFAMLMGIAMLQFRIAPLPELKEGHPARAMLPLAERITILSARNTLVIYVLHVMAMQWLAFLQHPERFNKGFQGLFPSLAGLAG